MMNKGFIGLILATSVCQALEPQMLTNAVAFVFEDVLGSLHECNEIMEGAVKQNGWTPRDCSDILIMAERALKGSEIPGASFRRQNAISLLGRYGGTNAIPELVSIMQNEDDVFKEYAGQGYLRVSASNPSPGWGIPLRDEIARSPAHASSFAWSIYNVAALELEYAGPPPAYQRNLLRFLLEQATVETGERAMLDEILCREVPKWRASPQRAENAARMKALHADNAEIVSFFTGIERDAAAARAAQAGDGGKDAPGGEAGAQGNRDADDPWADLLDDLPEKKPWEPPKGELSIIL